MISSVPVINANVYNSCLIKSIRHFIFRVLHGSGVSSTGIALFREKEASCGELSCIPFRLTEAPLV
ncbi:hypothetical protein [Treponema endosymbiont of Eucomonympha sp.]|uniref:hypothetical protein n=1 Tax=Treponema endosymbiont of Eucomonympha sp. TaxID=1580831 RepID=UPI000A61594B|nr:hypothetical protein [Treponema endosymbiont of Eucomonympha sp.]